MANVQNELKQTKKFGENKFTASIMVKIAMLSAIGFLLTFLKIPIPIFPHFLDLEMSDLPVVVGMLTMGPIPAVFVIIMKNILGVLIKPVGGGLGQLINFIVGCSYILPLSFIYLKNKCTKNFVIGSVVGTISMVVVAALVNYFIFIPAYAAILGVPTDSFVEAAAKVNGLVTNYDTLVLFAFIPFNIIKAVSVSIFGYIIYKAIKPVLGLLTGKR